MLPQPRLGHACRIVHSRNFVDVLRKGVQDHKGNCWQSGRQLMQISQRRSLPSFGWHGIAALYSGCAFALSLLAFLFVSLQGLFVTPWEGQQRRNCWIES